MISTLQLGGRQLPLSAPVVMGVLNVTPDSFSDGSRLGKLNSSGRFTVDVEKALQRAAGMLAEGARIIDVGGESTRPGATQVSTQEELDRVIPVVESLVANLDVAISVDTSNPNVMREACVAGAGMINDIRSLNTEGALQVAAQFPVAVCLMHMQGQPATMQKQIHYDDVVREVTDYLRGRVDEAVKAGIARSRLVVDPGFGFGKTAEHNYRLLQQLDQFQQLGLPVLVGLSRKSMIGQATGRPVEQRLHGSVAAAMIALERGARIIRTHDVAATLDAIGVHCAIQNTLRDKNTA